MQNSTAQFPALCSHCGLGFQMRNIIAGSAIVEMSNSRATCPRCGDLADIVDGTYTIVENEVRAFFKSTNPSAEELDALRRILIDAKQKGSTIEEVANDIANQAPSVKGLLDIANKHGINFGLLVSIVLAYYMWVNPISPVAPKMATASVRGQTEIPTTSKSKRKTRRNRGKSQKSQRNSDKCPK